MKDYYKILEIEEKSTQDDIKKSYRTLSKKYHPDVNPDGAEKFKEIAEAYSILGDKTKRDEYDRNRSNPFLGTEFEGFFSSMFREDQGRRSRKVVSDRLIKLRVTPVESYLGVEKEVSYFKEVDCGTCNGSGGEQQVCRECGGNGGFIKSYGTGYITQQVRVTCGSCGGKGYTLVHRCGDCGGNGVKKESNTFTIKVPIGVDNGQYLRMENYGDFRSGQYGDLIIQIEMVPENGFEKMNNNLIYNLFLNLDEVMGDKYSIPHPDGELKITPPKVFDTSKPLRLRGKGYLGGDMYINLNVKFERTD
jgi:molecular chaperone DnaJ